MEARCQCEGKELTKRQLSNGAIQFGNQCFTCGKWHGAIAKATLTPGQITFAKPYDDTISDRYWAEYRERQKQQIEDERQAQSEAWWTYYREYMASEKWKDKRVRVLERDNYLCQACLTYEHFGDEPLFDLESICGLCHEHLTQIDRERRNVLSN